MIAARGVLQVLPEQGPALDEGKPAEVLDADEQEIEGVEARPRAAIATQERMKVRQALRHARPRRLARSSRPGGPPQRRGSR